MFLFPGDINGQEIKELMVEGYQLVETKNYIEASKAYQKVIAIDSTHRDAYFNLASISLALNDKDKACEYFYKLYNLGDREAKSLIQQYCGPLQYTDVMDVEDITEPPKVTIKGKTKDFFSKKESDKEYDSRFVESITKAIKSSKLFNKYKGYIFTAFHINKKGIINLRIKGKNLTEEQIAELTRIFNSVGEITSAKFQGKDVGVGYFSMPLKF